MNTDDSAGYFKVLSKSIIHVYIYTHSNLHFPSPSLIQRVHEEYLVPADPTSSGSKIEWKTCVPKRNTERERNDVQM